jgi:hypothetical protein
VQSTDPDAATASLQAHSPRCKTRSSPCINIKSQDREDFGRLVERGDKMLREAGATVPEGFARMWLTERALNDERLRETFDNRYRSPQHLRRAEQVVDRLLSDLSRAAKTAPDPEATAVRAAVTAAIRGASTRTLPPEKAPDYGQMSDGEFRQELRKLGVG